jgi:hypothetical protein
MPVAPSHHHLATRGMLAGRRICMTTAITTQCACLRRSSLLAAAVLCAAMLHRRQAVAVWPAREPRIRVECGVEATTDCGRQRSVALPRWRWRRCAWCTLARPVTHLYPRHRCRTDSCCVRACWCMKDARCCPSRHRAAQAETGSDARGSARLQHQKALAPCCAAGRSAAARPSSCRARGVRCRAAPPCRAAPRGEQPPGAAARAAPSPSGPLHYLASPPQLHIHPTHIRRRLAARATPQRVPTLPIEPASAPHRLLSTAPRLLHTPPWRCPPPRRRALRPRRTAPMLAAAVQAVKLLWCQESRRRHGE